MDKKHRYLSNPFIHLDAKRKKQLGLEDEDLNPGGINLEDPMPKPRQEVIKRKKRDHAIEPPTFGRDTL